MWCNSHGITMLQEYKVITCINIKTNNNHLAFVIFQKSHHGYNPEKKYIVTLHHVQNYEFYFHILEVLE